MNARRISEILYRHDPAHTGCNACEDMEDEYDRISDAIADTPAASLSFEAFRAVMIDSFFDDAFADGDLERCNREITMESADSHRPMGP
ncbi:hypothetical protein CEW83_07605 [Parazoarcus communis]|uniref:Uncharacterized protein n=1 Tax=Parazoarcus communis TaxID=41977 RepID=A0A2U8GNM3_9RHOO|nr:hypothetical protein [Parazoarcus communis]AWI75100.1 hypothetical protein CEW83_07605 [Parazoarcus communis]